MVDWGDSVKTMKHWKRLLLLICLVLGFIWGWADLRLFQFEALRTRVASMGVWAPVGFIGMYVLGAVLLIPGTIFVLASGFLFGPVWGTLYSVLGAALGGAAALFVARVLLHPSWLEYIPLRWRILGERLGDGGWKTVALMRLIPAVPYNAANYALSLTPIHVWDCFWATLVFYLPVSAIYAYLGHLGLQALFDPSGHPWMVFFLLLTMTLLFAIPAWFLRRRLGFSQKQSSRSFS